MVMVIAMNNPSKDIDMLTIAGTPMKWYSRLWFVNKNRWTAVRLYTVIYNVNQS